MAIGVERSEVVRLVLRESLPPVACGIGVGLIAAVGLASSVDTLLFGISGHDPATMTVAAGILIIAAGLASWVPAARAARIDPLPALRSE